MKLKKIITAFLILVFVLQLFPVKQVARYFCFVNSTTKEIIDINESAAKKINTTVEDHHFLNDYFQLLYPGLLLNNIAFGLYVAMRPSSHADDIETPPPNVAFV